jgi:cytochrome c peroxidase
MLRRKSLMSVTLAFVANFWLPVYLTGIQRAEGAPAATDTAVDMQPPLGLPLVPYPEDNPPTAEKIALGRRLFSDPILSVDNTVACATCHNPALGFTDGKQFPRGVRNQKASRNAPSVLNAAYLGSLFWDGRATSLEKQVKDPVRNPLEMANTPQAVEKKLAADESYGAAFEKAFGPGKITFEKVEKAIASFERTLISGNSAFDRYFYGGDKQALTPTAERGLRLFLARDKGNCAACHSVYKRYSKVKVHKISAGSISEDDSFALFTDDEFHNTGIGAEANGHYKDVGRYKVTRKKADLGAFKTPTLRNIAKTGPYMHDGSLKTLKDVIDYYVRGGNPNPLLDKKIRPLKFLSDQERADLLAFLDSLTSEMPSTAIDSVDRPLSQVRH